MTETRQNISLGLVAAPGSVKLKSGNRYNRYFPKPENRDKIEFHSNDVTDTVLLMGKVITKYLDDTKKIAPVLKGKNDLQTCKNIYQFIYDHIEYKLDKTGHEELRRPAVTWAQRRGDCDCMSIFASSILTNLGIDHKIRIAGYDSVKGFQHVYVIVPDGLSHLTIDPVLRPYMLGKLSTTNMFNSEKPFVQKKDFTMSELGLPVHILSGIADERVTKVRGHLSLIVKDYDREAEPVLAMLHDTRSYISQYPEVLAGKIKPQDYLQMLDYAIKHWDTSQGLNALRALADAEKQLRDKTRFKSNPYLNTFTRLLRDIDNTDGIGMLGGWFSRLGRDVNTFSPLHATMRAAFRGLIKLNYCGYATRFAIGRSALVNQGKHSKQSIIDFVDTQVKGVSSKEYKKYIRAYEKVKNFYRSAGGTGNEWTMFKDVIREGKTKGAAVGKYEDTRKQRQALKLIEDAIKQKYGKAMLGEIDSSTYSEDQLGEPVTLAALIASAGTAIATVSTFFKDVKDGADLVKDVVSDAKDVVDTASNVMSDDSNDVPTKSGDQDSGSSSGDGKSFWERISGKRNNKTNNSSGHSGDQSNKPSPKGDNTQDSNTKKYIKYGLIGIGVTGGSLLAIRYFKNKNKKSSKGLSGASSKKKPLEITIK